MPAPDEQRNDDVDWDAWPTQQYLGENYRELHDIDAAVIDHHATYYAAMTPDSVDVSLEFGAGPNLYPLVLAAAVSRRIEAFEHSAANAGYLRDQVRGPADSSWLPFYERCRSGNPTLPATLDDAMRRVDVIHADARSVEPGRYGLASMHFVAESVTESSDEFADLCRTFVESVRPGGHLVAAFMENMARYRLGDGSEWPGYPVDSAIVRDVFEPLTDDLEISRIDDDPGLPAYGYTGMVLLTARRRPR